MTKGESAGFLAGVVEGFYGQPWSRSERLELFDWMAAWGLNTYLYAPKDDLNHRAIWRQPYSKPESGQLAELIRACRRHRIRFIYALSPGLDIRYGSKADLGHLRKRFAQMQGLGCSHFALLFDDIPEQADPEDLRRWGSLASAQCQVANMLFQWTRERCPHGRFLFCPTAYCGRMAERRLGGADYLRVLGEELAPEIQVLWTGPEIVSREIPVAHLQQLERLLHRKPVLWDNLHANDYDGRRFFCGPYAGRPPELRRATGGLLSNPNNEFPLNFVPLRTLAAFVHCKKRWVPRRAYLAAMREWLTRFETVGAEVSLEDLVLLGDCHYLPHEEGPEAEALYRRACHLLARNPGEWGRQEAVFRRQAGRLREVCQRLTALKSRPLFHALSRRLWELREELDLLDRCLESISRGGSRERICGSDFHLPGTYRGGFVARLQRLLVQQPDGSFKAAPGNEAVRSSRKTKTARSSAL